MLHRTVGQILRAHKLSPLRSLALSQVARNDGHERGATRYARRMREETDESQTLTSAVAMSWSA